MLKLNAAQKAWAKEFFETVVTAVILALIIRTFIIQPFKIPTGSMEPTLLPGDRILVLRFAYGVRVPFTFKRIGTFKAPETGDIIVFNYPEEPNRDFIKRCVGKPGDTVEIRKGQIYLNAAPLKTEPFNKYYYYNRGPLGREGEVLQVPQDAYFVLGDNSASSKDSRYWGYLNDKYLIGKAVMIYWPPNRIRILK
ncbi:MAG: signal peptidase I [Candidatus Omnitrophica bacterium]|nr:signal peptidase I [Candidatus Omnitrophota bacterium]MDD5574135.1 signal peptidase I [Candidatus Omnitrophota bacterium]